MNLIELINDSAFVRIVEGYNHTETEHVKSKIASWNKILRTDNFTIPILGVQGAGKSSLLNALLMNDVVLPVDSDETTCIPTEIIYSEKNSKEVDVHFFNGHIEKTSCDENGLKKYVHQEDNPDNKKGVECIKVYRNSPLLRNGVTFVDLPGVGSLSENNVKTTIDYIKNSTGAIFLLRTTPPITKSESIFIKMIWPLLAKVFFVQNQWNDETLQEVEDGRDHSMIVLEKIANESKLHKSDVNIDVINIYQSLTSRVTENISGLEKSGLIDLENKIVEFVKLWKNEVLISVRKQIIILLEDTEDTLLQEIRSVTGDREVLQNEYEEKRAEFERKFNSSKEEYLIIKEELEENKEKLSLEINETIKVSKEEFRNSIRTQLDKGITDGPKLEKVFNDLKSEQVNTVFEAIKPKFEDFIYHMQRRLEGIPRFSLKKDFHNEPLEIKENSNWNSLIDPVLSAGGGLGGLFAGVTIAGTGAVTAASAKVGAAIGVAAGPAGIAAGIVIGAAAGLLGSLIFSKIGKEGEKAIIRNRAKEARKLIFPLIEKWSIELNNDLQAQLSQLVSGMFENIDRFYEKAKIDFDQKEQKLTENSNKSSEQKERQILQLENDLSEIKRFHKMF